MSGGGGGGRHRTPGGGVQHVLDYLKRMQAENPAFFYAFQGENEHSTGNVFWADSTCKMNYNYFGDTVRLDTAYRVKGFKVPFVAFTGLNHHAQPVLFGCAVILDESESCISWLIQTWLRAMSGRSPVSITTDPDSLIQMAVNEFLPRTRHRFCKWSILRDTEAKLAHIYQTHPSFGTDLKKCVNETETVEEFESCWETLLGRYFLLDNEWLLSLFNVRHQWVPVFVRDIFFGELSRNDSGSDIISSFFEGYISATTTLQILIKQYEKAVANWQEKELKADYDTTNSMPALKTPSPTEKQAANLYTRRIFMKFQEELVETLANPATKTDDSGTIATYRVAKFGEEHKAHTVTFNSLEKKANCSCQMFEYSGIACRHILSVFRAKNVLTLPSDYLLKRWTRNAKSGGVADEPFPQLPSDSQESLTVRCNNLRQEAMKFVEEGAKSIHFYNIAMEALQEASKKVAAAKSQSSGATGGNALANGTSGEMLTDGQGDTMSNQSVEEKKKKIQELSAELESTNQKCDAYRTNLLAVLRDMEDQKLKLAVKVQNARLSLRE